jgi:hypothetical protein
VQASAFKLGKFDYIHTLWNSSLTHVMLFASGIENMALKRKTKEFKMSSGMCHLFAWYNFTDVSEECAAQICKV